MLYSLLLIKVSTLTLPLMALNSLYCADVQLSSYSLTHSLTRPVTWWKWVLNNVKGTQ